MTCSPTTACWSPTYFCCRNLLRPMTWQKSCARFWTLQPRGGQTRKRACRSDSLASSKPLAQAHGAEADSGYRAATVSTYVVGFLLFLAEYFSRHAFHRMFTGLSGDC